MLDGQTHYGRPAAHAPLSSSDLQRILDATYTLLRDTGVGFDPVEEAMDLLSAAGCDIDEAGTVRFPTDLVQASLASCAKSVRLWDRSGEGSFEIDCESTRFLSGMTCIRIYDLETGKSRESTRDDLGLITRVADALPEIDGVCVSCKNVPESNLFGEIDEFLALVENTTKPLEYLCEQTRALEAVIELAAEVRGGKAALEEKPYFMHIVTPLPLFYAETHIEQIIMAARHGVPVNCGTIAIGGASAPITMAGCMTHSLATDFAGMVLAQLVKPGVFSVGSSDAAFMEPATGGIGSTAQTAMADAALCQIRRSLGIPSLTGYGGCSVAREFNQDAVWEISSSMMQTGFAQPATCDYLGSLDEGITYSLHALLLCHDLAGMLRCTWQGIGTDDEQLALDLTAQEGVRGNYLAQRHTAKFCRVDRWSSRYFGSNIPLSSGVLEDESLFERIDRDLRKIIDEHEPTPLDEDLKQSLEAVLARYRTAPSE